MLCDAYAWFLGIGVGLQLRYIKYAFLLICFLIVFGLHYDLSIIQLSIVVKTYHSYPNMLFRSVFIAALSLTPILCSPSPSHGKYKPKGGKHCGSDDDLTIVDKYFEFWDGNGSLLNEIFSPGLTVYQDRLPTANGSATYPLFTREAYGEWWRLSREGYDPYRFTRLYDLRQGDKAVVRWTLDATLVDPQLALPGV